MLYHHNPNVLVIQSRLFSTGYKGGGKWILFNSENRKAYSAIRSDIISIMALASGGASKEELLDAVPSMTPQQFDQLIEDELIAPGDRTTQTTICTFVEFYHRSVFDYPFRDYSDADWRIKDTQLMAQYASQWPPPPSISEHEGVFYPLPDVTPESLLENDGNPVLTLVKLAAILRYTFGATAKKKTPHLECVRRTSPSGGSRHPTECIILLPYNYGIVPKGSYLYDVARHALVETPTGQDAIARMPQGCRLGLVIRSRVERAMWRYRDIRSFRPVLLDAGHIIETLSLLLKKAGLFATVSSQPLSCNREVPSLEEPDLVTVLAADKESIPLHIFECNKYNSTCANSSDLVTTPAFYMTFCDGSIIGNVIWPERRAIPLAFSDFQVLNYCLSSASPNRVMTVKDILAAVCESSNMDIERLTKSHVLIEKSTADNFYNAAGLWTRYDWYLSLLAHLEVLSDRTTRPTFLGQVPPADYIAGVDSLFARKTTRQFANIGVPRFLAQQVLTKAFSHLGTMPETSCLRILVAALAIDGLEECIYEWNIKEAAFSVPIRPINRDLVREMTIGQYPAGAGALTVWLVSRLDLAEPAKYEMDIIEIGRIGQRLCLVATAAGLGIFLTPAVCDKKTFDILNIQNEKEQLIYLISIGHKK